MVQVVIYPISHGMYRIQHVIRGMEKDRVRFFGPLFNGMLVPERLLGTLVRQTVINASRATSEDLFFSTPYK